MLRVGSTCAFDELGQFREVLEPQRTTGLHGPLTFAEHLTLTPEEEAMAKRLECQPQRRFGAVADTVRETLQISRSGAVHEPPDAAVWPPEVDCVIIYAVFERDMNWQFLIGLYGDLVKAKAVRRHVIKLHKTRWHKSQVVIVPWELNKAAWHYDEPKAIIGDDNDS